jgi:cytochrome c biogenesis protein CcmG/thiol:disulfide interchange protein DsbE
MSPTGERFGQCPGKEEPAIRLLQGLEYGRELSSCFQDASSFVDELGEDAERDRDPLAGPVPPRRARYRVTWLRRNTHICAGARIEKVEEAPVARRAASRRWLRVGFVLITALAFIGLMVFATLRTGGEPRVGEPVPDLSGPVLGRDGELALSEFEGRPVFVNFWWSGCAPCKDEASLLEKAHDQYGDEIAFLGVNIRDGRSDALAFADKYGFDFPSVVDSNLDIYRRWGLTGQPESFFIDEDGVLFQHIAGPVFESQLNQLLDALAARNA